MVENFSKLMTQNQEAQGTQIKINSKKETINKQIASPGYIIF